MLEQLRNISAVSLGKFEAYAKWDLGVRRRGDKPTREQQLSVMATLYLDPEQEQLLNDVWRTYHLGIPSSNHLVNIFVSGISYEVLPELLDRFNGVVDQKDAIDAYELGTNVIEQMICIEQAREFLDASVAMYCAEKCTEETEHDRCIAFPGMPDMHPLLSIALDMAQKYLRHGSMIAKTMTRFGDPEKNYKYAVLASDKMEPMLITGAGSIYLFGKPPRKDVAANHLKVVRNEDD